MQLYAFSCNAHTLNTYARPDGGRKTNQIVEAKQKGVSYMLGLHFCVCAYCCLRAEMFWGKRGFSVVKRGKRKSYSTHINCTHQNEFLLRLRFSRRSALIGGEKSGGAELSYRLVQNRREGGEGGRNLTCWASDLCVRICCLHAEMRRGKGKFLW